MSFAAEVRAYADRVKLAMNRVVGQSLSELSGNIIDRTPVMDGTLKANWQASRGSPANTSTLATDKEGSSTKAAAAAVAYVAAGHIFYLANNVLYAGIVEFGAYPNPVQRGSWVKAGVSRPLFTGPGYFKFSEGGFSKQAPAGMLRLSVREFPDIWNAAIARNRV